MAELLVTSGADVNAKSNVSGSGSGVVVGVCACVASSMKVYIG